ncbi:MAG: class I adenylate-forming enzyme family protein [Gammaproteobacteria bacterium]|nr:class I adenylate-forming enzyme family protein [Gammaproteobacteria bacterium]
MHSTTVELPFSFRHMSFAAGIRAAASREPDKIAFRHGERSRSYRQLVERISRAGAAIGSGLGLGPGDHGAIVAKNSIEYIEVVIGASEAGVALATVNPRLSPAEIVAICDDAQARVVFADAASAAVLRDADFASVERIIELGPELEDFLASARGDWQAPEVAEWGVFTIPYTSGTTGKPKGVLVPHRSRILTLFGMAVEYGCYSPGDRFLAIAPMCHGAGMIFSLAPVFFGGYAEVMDSFDPEAVMRSLKDEHMTGFFGVPTHFHAMMNLAPTVLADLKPDNLRSVISNAAPLPQPMKETLVDYFGDGLLHETYGSTEAGIVTNLRPPDQLRKQQCVGQPIALTEVEIRRDDGSICDADEVGELFSTSPYLFNGYWGRPEETEEAFHNGWVTVGDLARRDDEGHIYIVDRKKDMVISGGTNIYPREVEEVLISHPDIVDVAVVGVPDEKWGERLKAFIVTSGGTELSLEHIDQFCEGQISRMKTPREVELITQIPRNANGKVLKTELRKRAG